MDARHEPPVLVPAIQSKHSKMGRSKYFSNSINMTIKTKPLIPPPSKHNNLPWKTKQNIYVYITLRN